MAQYITNPIQVDLRDHSWRSTRLVPNSGKGNWPNLALGPLQDFHEGTLCLVSVWKKVTFSLYSGVRHCQVIRLHGPVLTFASKGHKRYHLLAHTLTKQPLSSFVFLGSSMPKSPLRRTPASHRKRHCSPNSCAYLDKGQKLWVRITMAMMEELRHVKTSKLIHLKRNPRIN